MKVLERSSYSYAVKVNKVKVSAIKHIEILVRSSTFLSIIPKSSMHIYVDVFKDCYHVLIVHVSLHGRPVRKQLPCFVYGVQSGQLAQDWTWSGSSTGNSDDYKGQFWVTFESL